MVIIYPGRKLCEYLAWRLMKCLANGLEYVHCIGIKIGVDCEIPWMTRIARMLLIVREYRKALPIDLHDSWYSLMK